MLFALESNRQRCVGFLAFTLLAVAAFHRPLLSLARYAARTDLYSHIFLIPPIIAYLVYIRLRAKQPLPACSTSSGPAIASFCLAAAAWLCWAGMMRQGLAVGENDSLAMTVLSFVTCIWGGAFLFVGSQCFLALAFPILFLVFLVPIPEAAVDWIDAGLQRASAVCLHGTLKVTGTPFLHNGMVFQLPGLTIEVAPECSGIRSTLVLFITSLLAGVMFLSTWWRRVILTLCVLPIAALRNAARITTIALLTIHVDPETISGPVHRRGGPPFFVLSLIPFFLILLALRRTERGRKPTATRAGGRARHCVL